MPSASCRRCMRTPACRHCWRGRTASSRQWLQRQLNDPYVAAARQKGYRSRAAFKLIELDSKYRFLKKGAKVLDLGAAPGGWSQVAVQRGATVVAADVLDMEPVPGVSFLKADLTDPDVPARLKAELNGPADLVLTDMAAPTTGHRATDHLRTIALVEMGEAADRKIGGYSKGMRQRIKVAAALVHDPDVLLMDEPLNGTDPVQRAGLISLMRQLGAAGKTLLVSSHVLVEVERFAENIVVIVNGKLAAAGDYRAIRDKIDRHDHAVRAHQLRLDRSKTRPVRQQRVKQE